MLQAELAEGGEAIDRFTVDIDGNEPASAAGDDGNARVREVLRPPLPYLRRVQRRQIGPALDECFLSLPRNAIGSTGKPSAAKALALLRTSLTADSHQARDNKFCAASRVGF